MLSKLLEPGQRKLMMTLVAIVAAVALEKFGGGLSQELKNFILSAVGIYAGTNVLSKGIHAVEVVKTAKNQQQQVDTAAPSIDYGPTINKVVEHVNKLDHAVAQKIQEIEEKLANQDEPTDFGSRIDDLEKRIDITTNNVTKLIDLVNRLGGSSGPTQPHR